MPSKAQPSTTRWRNIVRNMNSLYRAVLPITVLVLIAVIWQILASADTSRARVIPPPSDVLGELIRTRETLLTRHIPQTMAETLIGMAIALALGVVIAAVLDFSPLLKRALYPLLVISQTIPIVALAPVLILVFGFGIEPKVVVVV